MDVVIDVPEEICDINPQKTCHMATKMVPKLTPERECTQVPQEVCNLSYGRPKVKSRKKVNKTFLIGKGPLTNYVYKRRGVDGQKNQLFVNFYTV